MPNASRLIRTKSEAYSGQPNVDSKGVICTYISGSYGREKERGRITLVACGVSAANENLLRALLVCQYRVSQKSALFE